MQEKQIIEFFDMLWVHIRLQYSKRFKLHHYHLFMESQRRFCTKLQPNPLSEQENKDNHHNHGKATI
jgi:hypothetical protein